MTPLQALQSATLVAARLLRQEARLGKLQPGYLADIVAVSGDPAADVQTLEQPVAVLKEGALVFWQPRLQGSSATVPLPAPAAVRATPPATPAARAGTEGGAARPVVPGSPAKKSQAPRAGSQREGGVDVWR
jgi:adenine deaminase